MISLHSHYKNSVSAQNIVIHIPVPENALKPNLKASKGSLNYKPELNCLIWTIPRLKGQTELSLHIDVDFVCLGKTLALLYTAK